MVAQPNVAQLNCWWVVENSQAYPHCSTADWAADVIEGFVAIGYSRAHP